MTGRTATPCNPHENRGRDWCRAHWQPYSACLAATVPGRTATPEAVIYEATVIDPRDGSTHLAACADDGTGDGCPTCDPPRSGPSGGSDA